VEHPTAERPRRLHLDLLCLRHRRDGIPTPLVTYHYSGLVVESSRSEVCQRRLLSADISNSVCADNGSGRCCGGRVVHVGLARWRVGRGPWLVLGRGSVARREGVDHIRSRQRAQYYLFSVVEVGWVIRVRHRYGEKRRCLVRVGGVGVRPLEGSGGK